MIAIRNLLYEMGDVLARTADGPLEPAAVAELRDIVQEMHEELAKRESSLEWVLGDLSNIEEQLRQLW